MDQSSFGILGHNQLSTHNFDNLVKNLTVAGIFGKYIWFSLPVPKI